MNVRHDPDAQAQFRVAHRVEPRTTVVSKAVVPAVRQSSAPYHVAQNWTYDNRTWRGTYRAGHFQCPGEIWRTYGKFCARIFNVPPAVLHGAHSACFAPDPEKNGWYRIHFGTMPHNVDAAILAVEQRLQEARW